MTRKQYRAPSRQLVWLVNVVAFLILGAIAVGAVWLLLALLGDRLTTNHYQEPGYHEVCEIQMVDKFNGPEEVCDWVKNP